MGFFTSCIIGAGGGFVLGSGINMVREGIFIKPLTSSKTRKRIEQKRKSNSKVIRSIEWGPEDTEHQWWKD
jgi:hypothetical protein